MNDRPVPAFAAEFPEDPLNDAMRAAQAQLSRFDVAFNNLIQGVCFFDGTRRLILANRRYAEIYGLSPETIHPGTTLEEIVDRRYAAGTFPDMTPAEYLRRRAAIAVSDQPTDSVVELSNGQVISIHHRPMPDGGWVSTHEDITERRHAEVRLAHMARHDALTGLPNRAALREYVANEPERRTRGDSLAVLCLDLDNFKYVNDTFGHAVGDALLRVVADRIRNNVRRDDLVVRLGGDEFAVVQVGVNQPDKSAALASRLIEVLSKPFDLDGRQASIGTSVGIAYTPAHEADTETLLKHADMALYRAKAVGRGTFHFFDPIMNAQAQHRHTLETGLRLALSRAEFELLFQPIVNAQTGILNRFEALVRWRHPQLGPIEPSEFIPLAEESGLIAPIGEWVLKQALRVAATWPGDISVAVNLSVVQLRSDTLFGTVRETLRACGLPPIRLELEITETALLQNAARPLETLRRLQDLGVRISLDDFGTGYSSIGCLRTFRFDRVKIDQSFVRDLGSQSHSISIVHAIVDLATALGMSVVAEGVETAEQLRLLQAEACTEIQGYLFGAPVRGAEVAEIIKRLGAKVRTSV